MIYSGHIGRGFDTKQECPKMLEQDDDFDTWKQAQLVTCPHGIEEQVEIILEKYDKVFKEADTSFENVFYADYYLTHRYNFPKGVQGDEEVVRKEISQSIVVHGQATVSQNAVRTYNRARPRPPGHAD